MGNEQRTNAKFPGGLTRTEATVFYVVHLLQDLKKVGLVEGGMAEVTEKGEELWKQLEEINFRPTIDEIYPILMELTEPIEE